MVSIDGDLEIANAPVTNLELTALELIEGDLHLEGLSLSSISGLSSLTTIDGSFKFWANAVDLDSNSTDQPISISDLLSIRNNEYLTDLTAFSSISEVGSNLSIVQNSGLTAVTGLNNLSSVGQEIQVTFNDNITDISGFQALESAKGVMIADNPRLVKIADLMGISSLSIVELMEIFTRTIKKLSA